ncbi:MAG: mannosyltransferase family protein [Chloroflexota bacterium]
MTVARLGRGAAVDGRLVRMAAIPFAATRLPLLLAGVLSVAMLPVSRYVPSYWLIKGLDRAFDAFSRWDAWHYSRIAVSGYPPDDPSRAAFFPLFPVLMRALGELAGRTDRVGMFAAGVVVANLCLLPATMALIALVRLDLDEDDARRAAWYLLAFPTSLFLSAGYSESLFLLLTIGSLLACRRGGWLTAGVLGGLAALSRPVGIVMVVPLGVEALLEWRADRHRPWRSMWRPFVGAALPGLFLLGWMAFLGSQLGDPLAFLHAQDGWHRELGPPWDAVVNFLDGKMSLATGFHSLTDLAFTIVGVVGVVLAWRWLRPSYAAYFTAMLLVPLMTGSLVSMPRFVLVMFPVYLVLAILGRRQGVHETLLVVGMGLGGVYMALYAQWYWVA